MKQWLGLVALLVTWLTGQGAAHAAPLAPGEVPPLLAPWVGWLETPRAKERCPIVDDMPACSWPGSLAIVARDEGASFRMAASVDVPGALFLPGSSAHWPLDVRAGTRTLPVLESDGRPYVELERGAYTIEGRFAWESMPEALDTPPELGLVSLELRGQQSLLPRRDASGLLWLGLDASEAEQEGLELSVQRRIEDGNPLEVITRIALSVSGKARELSFPSVLVPGTRPIELHADLPAHLAADGTLELKAQAGRYQVEITAIHEQLATRLRAPQTAAPWPERETWVFVANEPLRQVELRGATAIDPSRTDLATDWHNLPTFALRAGETLELETRRRGEPEPAPNALTLERTLWLDVTGQGYTVRDVLRGQLHRNFRLDLAVGKLGRASLDGRDELITAYAGKSGVELRKGTLDLTAEWRLMDKSHNLPAVGWSEDVDSLSTRLLLPPGFMLLGAKGVDQVSGSWLDGWDLWDFFFVLLIALAVGKLTRWGFGLLALFSLLLCHHEPAAPELVWLGPLVATALLRLAGEGRWRRVVQGLRWLSLAALLLVFVPFSVSQVRKALYPHIEDYDRFTFGDDSGYSKAAPAAEEAPMAPAPEPAVAGAADAEAVSSLRSAGKLAEVAQQAISAGDRDYYALDQKAKRAAHGNESDPNAVVQTGPGLPDWHFQEHTLSWSGPVQKNERMELWLVPPPISRAWSLLTVLLSGALLFALLRRPGGRDPSSGKGSASAARVAGTLVLVLTSTLGGAQRAAAQTASVTGSVPTPELLAELERRLFAPPECAPSCLTVETLELEVNDDHIRARARVHAAAEVAYRAPGPLEVFLPQSMRVDGASWSAARRGSDGSLLIRLSKGTHAIELAGQLPIRQAIQLALGTPPHRVTITAPGWEIEGLKPNHHADGSISLRRVLTTQAAEETAHDGLVSWLVLSRELDLGLTTRVRTTLTRLDPARDTLAVRIPLLPGEAVNDAAITVAGGQASLQLARGQSQLSFESTLPPAAKITLRAATPGAGTPANQPWNESWTVRCRALYHCQFSGLDPLTRLDENGELAPHFLPFPGEQLVIDAERLEGARGESVTIDAATLALSPGARLEKGTLALTVRSSRGTTERIRVGDGVRVTQVNVDGQPRPYRFQKGTVEVGLLPGSHRVELTLTRTAGLSVAYLTPEVALGRAATNLRTELTVPSDRWLLWARGPALGPAVLFWGYLLVALLAALALGAVPKSPLSRAEWALLALGLTQVEAPIAGLVVVWLFALSYRAEHWQRGRWTFNLSQLALLFLTLCALGSLAYAVHHGLVVQPDMEVRGLGSRDSLLRWYTDRSDGTLPRSGIFSIPLWIYKCLMLAWALWLAVSLLRWLRRGFDAFNTGGSWKSAVKPAQVELKSEA